MLTLVTTEKGFKLHGGDLGGEVAFTSADDGGVLLTATVVGVDDEPAKISLQVKVDKHSALAVAQALMDAALPEHVQAADQAALAREALARVGAPKP